MKGDIKVKEDEASVLNKKLTAIYELEQKILSQRQEIEFYKS